MKVIFVTNGLTHYYNLVLSKLNQEPGIELIVVIPAQGSAHIGEGVYQTYKGAEFKIIELEEVRKLHFFSTFKGLEKVISEEKPEVVIVIENYLHAFLLDLPLVKAMQKFRIGLILKSIPFRFVSYEAARKTIKDTPSGFSRLPAMVNRFLLATGLISIARRLLLTINKYALNRPDAHVNYVEAYELWESYGIAKEKIFITRNSPDTDLLFNVKETLANTPPVLPPNRHRLLHVGRLVEWKRVDMLLRATARVRDNFPDVELVIIGNGPEEAKLKQLAQDLGINSLVTFTGGVYEPRELAQYYLASSLYVLAGMGGLSINEAMCFGLPVLCSVCDGTEKILVREGENGRYFLDGDEDDLVEKIYWFFERAEQLEPMGRKSVTIIRNDVNIHTVIKGYMDALDYVQQQRL